MSEQLVKLSVSAVPQHGFWRCGRHWTQAITVAEVTPDVAARLKAEPMLMVRDAPADTPVTPEPKQPPQSEPQQAAQFAPKQGEAQPVKPHREPEEAGEKVLVAGAAAQPTQDKRAKR